MLKGNIYPSKVHETSEDCRPGFPWCFTTSYEIPSETIERKESYGKFAYN